MALSRRPIRRVVSLLTLVKRQEHGLSWGTDRIFLGLVFTFP
jgi:hypothetical protein